MNVSITFCLSLRVYHRHNGAGKTTALNILTGQTLATSGNATVFGFPVETSIDNVREITGVCLQHDTLWPELTPMEHLQLFLMIKGIETQNIERETLRALQEVGLDKISQAELPSKFLSGGMQRRLSVAISILGDPKAIFLDEPSAGTIAFGTDLQN